MGNSGARKRVRERGRRRGERIESFSGKEKGDSVP
jgi:hypothetical protein